MKHFVGLLLIGFLGIKAGYSQLVLTVAGQVDSVGATNGAALLSSFNNPHGVAVDGFGNVYVADRFGHLIRKISTNGMVSTLAGTGIAGAADGLGTAASFHEPWGLCADSLGNVYVADTRNNKIRKIDVNGNVTTVAGTGNFGTSNGAALASTFGNPTGIEIDKNGILYVADHLTHIIRKIDPAGNVTTLAGMPFIASFANGTGSQARFNRPYGLTLDNDGNILVADEWNHRIRKITPTGVVTTVAGSGNVGSQDGQGIMAEFNYPWDMTVDSSGNIFVADGYNDIIRKISPTGLVETYAGTAGNSGAADGTGPAARFNGATSVAYLKTTDEVYVGDAYNNLIRKIINLNVQTVALQLTSGTSTVICEGETLGFRAVPEIYDAYDFYVGGNLVQSSTSEYFTAQNLAPGNYIVSVTAYDNNQPIVSPDVFIQVLAAPNPTISVVGDATFFVGDSVRLIASAGANYVWNTGATTGVITVFNTGEFWVDVTNSNGCTGRSDTVTVTAIQFSPDPVITIFEGAISVSPDGSVGTLCFGTEAVLRSSYNTNNQWYKDGFPISGATGISFFADETGEYQVEVVDTLGFTLFSNLVNIIVLPKQINDFTALPNNPKPNDVVQFTPNVSNNVTNYFWNFGNNNSTNNISNQANPTHIYGITGTYTVTLVTSDLVGCGDTLSKINYLTVTTDGNGGGTNDPEGVIFIPSAFTPNGDGNNDIFYVRGANIDNLEMSVYNQWGERIFYSDVQDYGWDGTFGGRLVQLGTYVYIVEIALTDGTQASYRGYVTVLR